MRRPDGDRHHAHVEAAVEGGDQVDAGRVDEGHVVAGVEPALLQQRARDLLGLR